MDDNPQLPKTPKIPFKLEDPNLDSTKEPELLKTIEKLKGELAEKDKKLRDKDNKISLLTGENKKLKTANQEKDSQLLSFAETLNKVELEKDKKLKELQEKIKQLTIRNKSLIENSANLKNTSKNLGKIKEKQGQEFIPKNNNFLLSDLSRIKKPQNNLLVTKDQAELQAQIQV